MMCGIAGKLFFDPEARVSQQQMAVMARRLNHRGPDDSGVWISGPVGLCHARLSIIDLSPAGHQPMTTPDSSAVIVFNGEIYNFQQLRAQLQQRGYQFQSQTDTETVLYLWQEYGTECVRHLRGMFAFAVWDQRARQLFLARDRIGKKPLKYFKSSHSIIFASELKAILTHPDVPRTPDDRSISDYLTYQYVPTPATGLVGIQKLPPAHWMLVDADGTTHVEQYWNLDYTPKHTMAEPELLEEFSRIFQEAVRLRMISDVPLGAFLSGGIDSSAVVWAMAQASSAPVRTFSIGFQEKEFDETMYARQVAALCGTQHQEFVVQPDALEVLPELIEHYEEPYADSSALPTWYLARQTREYVTVALNGDGGDESCAGYRRHRYYWIAQMLPGGAWWLGSASAARALDHLCNQLPTKLACHLRKAAVGLRNLAQPRHARYPDMWAYFSNQHKHQVLTEEFLTRTNDRDSYHHLVQKLTRHHDWHPLDRVLFTDVATYLPDDLLVKVDIASMAHGLECRSPLLDQELMQFCARLPVTMKANWSEGKLFLKKFCRGKIPDEILDRPKKGFGVPLDAWFRGPLYQYACEVLLDRQTITRGYFRQSAIETLLTAHRTGRARHGARLWALITLELWFRRFIDQSCS